MTITAKYPGTCPKCSAPITPGQQVEWSKGSKAVHSSCAGTVSTAMTGGGLRVTSVSAPAPRKATHSRGKWTGCSCGSREDSRGQLIPSARNCATCNHDA